MSQDDAHCCVLTGSSQNVCILAWTEFCAPGETLLILSHFCALADKLASGLGKGLLGQAS